MHIYFVHFQPKSMSFFVIVLLDICIYFQIGEEEEQIRYLHV